MIDDSGFRHLRVRVLVPGLYQPGRILDGLFHNPEVSTTLLEAGTLDGRPFFDVEVFGVASEVDRALGPGFIEPREESPAPSLTVEARV